MAGLHAPYPPEFRQQIIELVRIGRTPAELAQEFEPTATTIRKWVKQADRDDGLCHVAVSPSGPAPGAAGALMDRFDEPDMDFGSHGERHRVWNRGNCVVEPTEPGTGLVSFTIQPPYLD